MEKMNQRKQFKRKQKNQPKNLWQNDRK